ncbi:MAG: hypothetical protein HUJ26_24560 [Planctomycetaceae bacterium]|nr:hypothetical protein [Planctomycetaceae bacterium]
MSVTTPHQQSEVRDPCADRARYAENGWDQKRLKVSQQDGDILARPSLDSVDEIYYRNREELNSSQLDIQGLSLKDLRETARDELIDLAVNYTAHLRQETVQRPDSEGVICDGHQPLLFHSGVWAKNFVLGGLAAKVNAVPLHLIVDNDSGSSSGISVPTGSIVSPEIVNVSYDAPMDDHPWEEISVRDLSQFESLSAKVSELMNPWGIQPLISQCWPQAVNAAKRGDSLSDCLSLARHAVERQWGLENLELPLSQVCDSQTFRRFFCHVISHLPCFRELYNQVLEEYRDVNGIRSQTHPVPELKAHDSWLEAPFWVWSESSPRRQPLYVKRVDREILLASEFSEFARLELSAESTPESAIEQLSNLRNQGWKIRSRALTTTLYARLCLSDLFIHGIGGAKYDEMTDRLMTRFYGIKPPEYLTLSGTWHLPIEMDRQGFGNSKQSLQRKLRDLDYNPEKYLGVSHSEECRSLIEEKQRLVNEQHRAEAGERLGESRREHHRRGCERYRRLKLINAELAKFVETSKVRIRTELEQARHRADANKILKSREYSFVLFPEEKLRPAMKQLEG